MADPVRVASFNTELSRQGPGLLLRDILRGDPQVDAVAKVIAEARADILLLQDVDYDQGLKALSALRDRIADQGLHYPYLFALPPNSGLQSGVDLNGDGWIGGPGDAQGYGRFAGQGGMAILSRLPVVSEAVQDFSAVLWSELPGALGPAADGVLLDAQRSEQRLSSVGHWIVPIRLPDGALLSIMAFHATPPVFDGPEDRNGYRNADEIQLWRRVLDGDLGRSPNDFVLLGVANQDPDRGEGRKTVLRKLLADSRLQDPQPQSTLHGSATVHWESTGPMRVDYVLPSATLRIVDAAVVWPALEEPMARLAETASRHRLVWVDLETRP